MPHTPYVINRLEEVIEEDPGNGNATFSRGLIHYDLKNYTMTEDFFLQTLEITPDDPKTLYNLGVLYSGMCNILYGKYVYVG